MKFLIRIPFLLLTALAAQTLGAADITADDFFSSTHVWDAHFTFTPAAYKGLAPVAKEVASSPRLSRFEAPDGLRNGITGASGLELEYVHGSLNLAGRQFDDIGVRYKGNGTLRRGIPLGKVSLKADLNKYVAGQKFAKLTKVNFNNNVADQSFMNETLAYSLYRDARVPAARTSYARLYITVPGQLRDVYQGTYTIVEEVDDRFLEDRLGHKDGLLFKPVIPSAFTYLGDDWAKYKQIYDPKHDPTAAQTARVIDFSRLVTSGSDADFTEHAADYLDLDEFARYMAVTVWLSNYDGVLDNGQNHYVWLDEKTGRFSFFPWDLDHSFGQFFTAGDAVNVDILHPWTQSDRFMERVFRLPAFRKLYLGYLAEFSATIFKPERFAKQVDEIAAALRPAVADESPELLARFNAAAAGRTMPDTLNRNFGLPALPIKAFTKARAQAVLDQLAKINAR